MRKNPNLGFPRLLRHHQIDLRNTFKIVLMLLIGPGLTFSQSLPTLSKSFSPSTIGPGSVSTLTYVISNPTGSPIENISFTDDLLSDVTFANPSAAFSDCGGIFSLDGPSSLSFSGGRLGAGSSCTIRVDVTSSVPGAHSSTTSSLTWGDESSSAGVSATLTVDAGRPGVTLAFNPSTIPAGGVSTMTITIDNSAGGANISNANMSVQLPPGLTIASPANSANDCGISVVTTVGSTSISFFGGALNAGASCSVKVDVTALNTGAFVVKSSDLTASVGANPAISCGFASALLNVPRTFLVKSFVNDPTLPGGTVNLQYTLTNLDRSRTATNIEFTDDLDAVITGLVPTELPTEICNGGVLTNNSTLMYSGGQLGPGESCTFVVNLQVPGGTAIDGYPSSTSAVTYDLDGEPIDGNMATDILYVQTPPVLTMAFAGDPVVPGGEVTLTYTITNTNSTLGLTDISFSEIFNTVFFEQVAIPLNPCGANSVISYTDAINPVGSDGMPPSLILSGASLGPGASCSFELTLKVPENSKTGLFNNATSIISALLDGNPVEGVSASDNIVVVTAPKLAKSFTSTKAEPGGIATIVFTLSYGSETASDATGISFSDNLADFIPGATAIQVASESCPGNGNIDLTNDPSIIAYSGGSLSPGTQCSFSVDVQIPSTAAAATYTNTTSSISSTIGGIETNSPSASADLNIPYLVLGKEFLDDPVAPGTPVNLQFTITNFSDNTISDITFVDNLHDALPGLTYPGLLVPDVCGAGSTLEMIGENLRFTGGSLAADASCSFTVTLEVPAAAIPDTYINRTGLISGDLGGNTVIGAAATDMLEVGSAVSSLTLSKTFPGNTANPGDVVDLTFEISFAGAVGVSEATNISFTDDLNAMLSGAQMVEVSTTNNTCNFNPSVPTSLVNFTLPSLADGATCSTTVLVKIPDNASSGLKTNTTTAITADGITGNVASDNLEILEGDRPPIAEAGPAQTVECTGGGSADVTLDASGSTHFVSQPYTYIWQNENEVTIGNGEQTTVSLGLGSHTITLIASDAAGSDTDEVMITVQDLSDPVITCPDGSVTSFDLIADASCQVALPDYTSEASASDICSGNVMLSQSPAPGTTLIGHGTTHQITITADDGNGNTASCDFTVTVLDETPPEINLLGDDPYIIYRFHPYMPAANPETSITDNCDPAPSLSIDASNVNVNLAGIYVVNYEATDAAGNSSMAQRTVQVLEDPQVLAHNYLLLAGQNIILGAVSRLDGSSHANALISISKGVAPNKGGPTIYDSDLTAVNQITVARDNTVNGNITAPQVSLANNVTVNGTVSLTAVSTVQIPAVNYTAGGNNVTVAAGATLTLSPESYGNLLVGAGATLQLTTGNYYFTTITINDGANLAVSIPTGPVEINSVAQILIGKNINMTMLPGFDAESEYLRIQSLTDIFVGENSHLLGQLIAPNGQVNFAEDIQLRGSICAKFIYNDKGGTGVIGHDAPAAAAKISIKQDIREINHLVRPNPFTESINITGEIPGSSNHGTIRVIDISNREIYRMQLQTKQIDIQISTGDWIPGMYFISISGDQANEVTKVVKVQ